MKIISSRDNQYIKDCLKLKQRKYRDKTNHFIIEGQRIFKEAVTYSPHSIKQIFIEESEVNKYDLAEVKAEIFIISSKLMLEISDTDTPQGILAVVEKLDWDLEKVKRDNNLFVLLDNIADPGNIGTIIRTALAFNIGGVLLTLGSVDPYSPKVIRSTMGGIFHLPIFQNITLSDIENFKNAGFKLVGSSLNNAINYYEYDYKNPTILIIGNEAHGISHELLNRCDNLVKIPINVVVDSLNAGVACGIILSEAWKQKST